METNKMKNKKNTLLKWILGIGMLLAGTQSAFAGMACGKAVYFTLPAGWKSAYVVAGGQKAEMTKSGHGDWLTVSTDKIGGQNEAKEFFIEETGANDCNSAKCARKDSMNVQYLQLNKNLFTCADFGTSGELWISAHPDATKDKETYFSSAAPNAKLLYMMIPPDYEEWMSSVPMVSMDGGKTGKPLTADPDKCGWYSYMWLDEEISDEVVFFRDDDELREDMIGLNGNWETSAQATSIPLGMLFEHEDTLYFVPDQDQFLNPTDDGWYTTFPEGVEGTCSYTMAAIIYDTDAALHPAFSCYSAGGEGCQNGAQGIDQTSARAYVNACLGVQPGLVEPYLDPAVPQKLRKPKLSAAGANCFINDAFFNQLFTYTPSVNEKSCYDMPFKRSVDGKWEFDSDYYHSPGVEGPGGFYPVEQSTDASILAADPAQTPQPLARKKRAAEGPVFYGPALRELDPVEGMPKLDILCNGPGWNKGENCTGKFNSGSDAEMAFAVTFVGGAEGTCVMGWSCEKSAPTGWHFFKSGTDTEVDPSTDGASYRWSAMRNQHYCFESHAQFTQKPGLRFNFRGDDDIWVFIDNKLAVDLGGTHLAAPGYVDLDAFEGLSGKLINGNQYDLDIFFCDRRTTMSNVRIKTNMYIMQKTAISVTPKKDPANPAVTSYEMCYTKSGDGSCASASTGSDEEIKCCGKDFFDPGKPACTELGNNISYRLANGNTLTEDARVVTNGTPGFDLSDITNPKINKEQVSLPPGRWTLFVVIDGKPKKVATFRMTGDVDVLYGDAVALDSLGNPKKNGNYKFVSTAMGGSSVLVDGVAVPASMDDVVPVYISALAKDDKGSLIMLPDDAVGVSYNLDIPSGMKVYRKGADGSLTQITSADAQIIGPNGVDTVYAFVPLIALNDPIQKFKVKVASRTQDATISFYLPTITFVESDSSALAVTGMNVGANFDPEEDQYDVGSYVPLYLMALKPNGDGTYKPCETCNFGFSLSDNTSPKIDSRVGDALAFVNGRAVLNVRSMKEYSYEMDSPATIEVIGENPLIVATYSPAYFRNPPVPFPVLVDLFDTKGKVPSVELSIPSPYFSMNTEYLDGIADSVAIYYNRRIHQDSLPRAICIAWDSVSTTSADTVNPTKLDLDNMSGDSAKLCNGGIIPLNKAWCENVDGNGYCDPIVKIGGGEFSRRIKTGGAGAVYSYAVYKNKKKGTDVKKAYDGSIVDRIAPVIMSATVDSVQGGYISLELQMSEGVTLLNETAASVLDFYLSTSTELAGDARYASAFGGSSTVVKAMGNPKYSATDDGYGTISLLYLKDGIHPDNGDVVRLSGDLANIVWSDAAEINVEGSDTLRATADAAYHWNSPTGYKETERLPSAWVEIQGMTGSSLFMNKFAHTGNAAEGVTDPFVVNVYSARMNEVDIKIAEGGIPQHLVKSNMPGLLHMDEYADLKDDLSDVYFNYEVSYFTNLGGYVAGTKGRIYCDDAYNAPKQYFNGGKCTDDPSFYRIFSVGWNMLSDKGRTVGTGAYITKINSYVRLGSHGKKESLEETSVVGVKRSATPSEDYLKVSE